MTSGYRSLWVDATYTVWFDGLVISQATVVAVGITTDGDRQVLGIDVGPSEDRACMDRLFPESRAMGLKGVRLVTSDAHEGWKQATSTVLSGRTWQRRRVHFMRKPLGDRGAGRPRGHRGDRLYHLGASRITPRR